MAAGALLLDGHAEGFAATVVEGMTVHAHVVVTEQNTGGSSVCCGGSFSARLKPAWPPLGVYTFDGCGNRLQPGATVLAGGTDPAYYKRQVLNASYQVQELSGCGCNPDEDLVRQHCLTTLLFASADRPPVRAHLSQTIMWQGPDAYRADMAAFIAEQQQAFTELARRLGEQGLLTADDAGTIRPRLQISVWDQWASREPALPAPAMLAENVTVEPL